jgi:aquaporin Z
MTRNPWNQLIAEAAGTFLFFFVGAGAAALADFQGPAAGGAGPGLVTIALAHGLVLAVLVSALGAVSGAHFNPAVTFAVWLAGHIESRRAVTYVLAQLIGGLAAGLALRAVFSPEMSPSIGTPALAPGISPAVGIGIEVVLTVVLLVAVFGTAVDPRGPKVGGLAIGFAVAADILMGGPLTGAAMNPARWFGPAVATQQYGDWYVWIVGPLVGAAIAAAAYRFLLLPEADPLRSPARPEADVERESR